MASLVHVENLLPKMITVIDGTSQDISNKSSPALLSSLLYTVEPLIAILRCSLTPFANRNVYRIASPSEDVCLSGTAEMAIGGYLRDKVFSHQDLPLMMAAVSRCYRAETSSVSEERGIYRVHYFTKVEMFGVTPSETGKESQNLHSKFTLIQQALFSQLGIHFQPAYRPALLHDA
ncbi:seryl-tRNA synthetase [Halocaridina rubra]|uniref:Seryl-tRNA synthetase n=1 Tax=Halocaridina rubra TaxID=373956 RepID=A0AAN8WRD1_HALRR